MRIISYYRIIIISIIIMLSIGLMIAASIPYATYQAKQFISSYINNNPQLIINALNSYAKSQQAQQVDDTLSVLEGFKEFATTSPFTMAIKGDDDKAYIYEFVDLNCGYCKKQHHDIKKLSDAGYNIIIVPFPILSDDSYHKAVALYDVYKRDKDKALTLYNNYFDSHQRTDASFFSDAATDDDYQDFHAYYERIQEYARLMDIRGTPALIIGDDIFRGYKSYNDLTSILKG